MFTTSIPDQSCPYSNMYVPIVVVQSSHLVPIIAASADSHRSHLRHPLLPKETVRLDSHNRCHSGQCVRQHRTAHTLQHQTLPSTVGLGVSGVQRVQVIHVVALHAQQLRHRLLRGHRLRVSHVQESGDQQEVVGPLLVLVCGALHCHILVAQRLLEGRPLSLYRQHSLVALTWQVCLLRGHGLGLLGLLHWKGRYAIIFN